MPCEKHMLRMLAIDVIWPPLNEILLLTMHGIDPWGVMQHAQASLTQGQDERFSVTVLHHRMTTE